jgi:hypothetical protein
MKKEIENTYRGFTYIVLALDRGHRCGYVRIPSGHFLYKKGYSESLSKPTWRVLKNAQIGKRGILSVFCADGKTMTMDILFNVHGGITFAGDFKKELGIKGYWIGFDCAHSGDGKDTTIMDERNIKFYKEYPDLYEGPVRTKEYVEQECKNLIDQIKHYYK